MDGGAFVSYRREDAAGFAGRLCDSLERLLPSEPIFRDVDGLSPGQDFVEAIDARLRQCRVCLAVIGRDWLHARDAEGRRRLDQPGDFVRLELTAALARPEVLVSPVLVEGAVMPAADALPSEIRALARRQAVSLRDDTWDADVARLVQSLQPAMTPSHTAAPPAAVLFPMKWRIAAVAGVILLALIINAWRSDDAPEDNASGAAPASSDGGASPPAVTTAEPAAAAAVPGVAGARDLTIPRISQVGSRGLVYTLMSARLEPGGSSDTLRLRVALENDSDGGVNFWDDLFRLVIDGDVLPPNSGLNAIVAGHATAEGTVTFSVPAGATRGLVRITAGESAGEIPLDFTGRPPAGGPAATGARSARAIVTAIATEPRPLVTAPRIAATLTGVTTRRFANVLRVDLPVRLVAASDAGILSGELTLRLVVGDDVLAPTIFPSLVIAGGATQRLTVAFEVPPDTTRAVLRAMAGEASADMPLALR